MKEYTRARLLDKLQNVLCGDYCVEDNCRRCNELRLELIEAEVSEEVKQVVIAKGRTVRQLVDDGLLHPDARKVLLELIRELP